MKIATVICTILTALVLAAAAAAGVAKFTLTGETLTDETGTVTTTGVIQAGSKTTGNGNTFTSCGYFTADGAYLGQFETAGFASTDATAVESFCLSHLGDRAAG